MKSYGKIHIYNYLMNLKIILIISLTIWLVNSQCPYRKVVPSIDPQARCLDGSPAALYVHKGDPRGGSCRADGPDTLQNCYIKSKTILGSSLLMPRTSIDLANGILSRDKTLNSFANWTKIILPYCDGSIHQGYTKQPYDYKDTKLYFRGSAITRAAFAYVDKKFNFEQAEHVLLTGSSAGGLATLMWADYLQSLLKNPTTKYQAIVDSGMFLDPLVPLPQAKAQTNLNAQSQPQQTTLSIQLQPIYQLANKDQTVPNTACAQANPTTPYNCMAIQFALPHLQTQTLFIQSSYDKYQLTRFMAIDCISPTSPSLAACNPTQQFVINYSWQYFIAYMSIIVAAGKHSVWSISCSVHMFIQEKDLYDSPLWKVPGGTGSTAKQAIQLFVSGQKVAKIDSVEWPNNAACAN